MTSAATPLSSENAKIGTTRTSPTSPSAMPLRSGGTSSDTCQSSAACCMNDPAKDTPRPIQSSRKFLERSAGNTSAHREEQQVRVCEDHEQQNGRGGETAEPARRPPPEPCT